MNHSDMPAILDWGGIKQRQDNKMVLSESDIVSLTGKIRRPAQARVLNALNIPYRRRPNGTIVIFSSDLHAPTEKRPTSPRLRL
ncbi:DUF4224 domain-containing protein [Laribacter hongkongensis]